MNGKDQKLVIWFCAICLAAGLTMVFWYHQKQQAALNEDHTYEPVNLEPEDEDTQPTRRKREERDHLDYDLDYQDFQYEHERIMEEYHEENPDLHLMDEHEREEFKHNH